MDKTAQLAAQGEVGSRDRQEKSCEKDIVVMALMLMGRSHQIPHDLCFFNQIYTEEQRKDGRMPWQFLDLKFCQRLVKTRLRRIECSSEIFQLP
jgi:hypothetical protein